MLDLIASYAIRLIAGLFNLLPINLVLALGRFFGGIAYYINAPRRKVAYANLKSVFSKEKTPRELKRLTKMNYRRLGETIFEVLSLARVDKKYLNKYVKKEHWDRIGTALLNGKGVLYWTAHFDNWELLAIVSALCGHPFVALVREQGMKQVNALLEELRESKGITVVRKGASTKHMLRELRKNKPVGMLGDQNAGKTGVFVDFFGRLTSTASGTPKIAAKTGAVILPSFIYRVKGPYHNVVIEKPIFVKKGDDIAEHLATYNKILEGYIRRYPEQWLWLHKRWKVTPTKKVLIISDGKAGHLNQARALAEKLKRYRVEMDGYAEINTEIEIITPRFKNKFCVFLLKICASFSSKNCQGCMKCLKACLRPDSYEELMKRYCDIVISCGAGVAAVNRFIAIENNAKNAIAMKPSILGTGKFSMVVVPRHDSLRKKAENIIFTDIAPNLISKKTMEEGAAQVSRITGSGNRKKIGVLLGGDNSDFVLTEAQVKSLLDDIIRVSRNLKADILFTTSRRTSARIEELAKKKLSSFKGCRLLVLANEKNMPFAVSGILGLSDVVVVSGESVSMVSEAVASGKPVITFMLQKKKRKKTKFEKMLENLKEKNHIVVVSTDRISQAVEENINKKRISTSDWDKDDAYRYMWRLL